MLHLTKGIAFQPAAQASRWALHPEVSVSSQGLLVLVFVSAVGHNVCDSISNPLLWSNPHTHWLIIPNSSFSMCKTPRFDRLNPISSRWIHISQLPWLPTAGAVRRAGATAGADTDWAAAVGAGEVQPGVMSMISHLRHVST